MVKSSKLIPIQDKFFEFIKGLDTDFEIIKEESKKTLLNSNADDVNSAKKLRGLSDLLFTTAKKKKEENFAEKTKVAQQLMNQYNNNEMSSSYDVSNNLRTLIQKNSNHFELSYNDTVNKFCKPVIGSLWQEINEWLSDVNELTLQELHRSHEIQLTIATETIDNIYANVRDSLITFAKKDVSILVQKINDIQKKAKEYLDSCSISGYSFVQPAFILSDKYEDIIRSSLRIEMPYLGAYPKKNFRSLIFEMRSFSMMFLLLLSSFGINQYLTKDPKAKFIVYVISLVLIVIGILVTLANAQDSREEKMQDELKKAKERISNEIRRAVNEFVSEWRTFIFVSFKTTIADISNEIDLLIREDTKKRTENSMAERLKLTQLSQLLDLKDRAYQDLVRKCETWKLQIDTMSDEIEKYPEQLINN